MSATTRRTAYIRPMSTPTKCICSCNRRIISPRGYELKFNTCKRSNSIMSPQAVSLRVMIRSSTVGSRRSAVAAALSMSKNAEDLTVVASKCMVFLSVATALISVITPTAGHTRRPRGTASSHPYDFHLDDTPSFQPSRPLPSLWLLSPAARRAPRDAETWREEGAKENFRGQGGSSLVASLYE